MVYMKEYLKKTEGGNGQQYYMTERAYKMNMQNVAEVNNQQLIQYLWWYGGRSHITVY